MDDELEFIHSTIIMQLGVYSYCCHFLCCCCFEARFEYFENFGCWSLLLVICDGCRFFLFVLICLFGVLAFVRFFSIFASILSAFIACFLVFLLGFASSSIFIIFSLVQSISLSLTPSAPSFSYSLIPTKCSLGSSSPLLLHFSSSPLQNIHLTTDFCSLIIFSSILFHLFSYY